MGVADEPKTEAQRDGEDCQECVELKFAKLVNRYLGKWSASLVATLLELYDLSLVERTLLHLLLLFLEVVSLFIQRCSHGLDICVVV